jgi:hypothetical protein
VPKKYGFPALFAIVYLFVGIVVHVVPSGVHVADALEAPVYAVFPLFPLFPLLFLG